MTNLLLNDYEGLPLFQAVASRTCNRCFDTGLWLTENNQVEACPVLVLTRAHNLPNAESRLLRRSAELVKDRKIYINPQAFDLARLLTNFDSLSPCPRQEIFETFYDSSVLTYPNQLRKFHALIEELRSIWLLPIGSRKTAPSGYWIITDLQDFKNWFNRVKSAPITQLSTIHKVARHNFPLFAEQLELEFWKDINNEVEATADVA